MWPRRTRRGAAARVDLDRGERVLASSELVGDGAAVATTHRLVVVEGSDTSSDRWTEIAGATLEAGDGVLEVERVDGGRRALLLGPGTGRALATTVRERVQHSILLARVVELGDRRTVRVVARREPSGEPFVQVVPGPGVRVSGPDVAAAVAEAERVVRDQVGLPPVP